MFNVRVNAFTNICKGEFQDFSFALICNLIESVDWNFREKLPEETSSSMSPNLTWYIKHAVCFQVPFLPCFSLSSCFWEPSPSPQEKQGGWSSSDFRELRSFTGRGKILQRGQRDVEVRDLMYIPKNPRKWKGRSRIRREGRKIRGNGKGEILEQPLWGGL